MENTKQETQEHKISAGDMLEISIEEITKNLKDIVRANVAVWRRNREKQLVAVPVKKLEQYLVEKDADSYKFYIEKNWRERIKDFESRLKKPESKTENKSESTQDQKETASMKELEKYGRVEEQVAVFRKMSVVEREEILDECISKLSEGEGKNTLDAALIVSMVGVLSNTFYANNANLEDNISTSNQRDNISGVLVKSNWIVKILLNLFDQKKYPYNDFKVIDRISTGSKIIDHINKVFLRFISFCAFFNEFIDKGLFTKDIRGAYKDKYHRYYKKIFPDREVTIERIFKNGIRRIEKEKEFQNYALGALLFDIGKIRHINYHDGSDPYNEDIVKSHALHGYNMIIKARQYPFEALAMSIFHHEYYGGKGSYNFTKPILSKFSGKKIAEKDINYFISYDKDDFINGISLSYFPCKVIEIIDIFDALVSKKYFPVLEAFRVIKREFITKSFKIDPIIFRIFLEYNVRCGALGNDEMEDIDSIIF